MYLKFTLKKEDYVALLSQANEFVVKKESTWVRKLLGPVLLTFLAFNEYQKGLFFGSVMYLSMAGLYLIFTFFLQKKLLLNILSKRADLFMKDMYDSEINLFLTDNTLNRESKAGKEQVLFSAIKNVYDTNLHYFIRFIDGGFIVIPKRDLNDFELNAFIDKLKERSKLE